MNYVDYHYLYPPRPEKAIPVSLLGYYEKKRWVAQVKKNGTCTVVFAKGNDVIFKTRHADDHKQWQPKAEHVSMFKGFKDWNVFVLELIHNKTPHIKDQLYLFDYIVKDGIQLVGEKFSDRYSMMRDHFGAGDDEGHYHRINKGASIAKNFESNFADLFLNIMQNAGTDTSEDEGLVLKNPGATLKPCFKSNSNDAWMVKARIPHKNYGF